MIRGKQTTINLVMLLFKEVEVDSKASVVLTLLLFQIFLKIFLVILVEIVLQEEQVIEVMI